MKIKLICGIGAFLSPKNMQQMFTLVIVTAYIVEISTTRKGK